MLTKLILGILCGFTVTSVWNLLKTINQIEERFDAIDNIIEALEKLFVKMNRNVETHSEVFHDTYAEIGKLKHDYERLRCYVYNSVQPVTEEEDTEDAV